MTDKELKQFDAAAKKLIHLTCNAGMHEVTFEFLQAAIRLLAKARAKEEDYSNELARIRKEVNRVRDSLAERNPEDARAEL